MIGRALKVARSSTAAHCALATARVELGGALGGVGVALAPPACLRPASPCTTTRRYLAKLDVNASCNVVPACRLAKRNALQRQLVERRVLQPETKTVSGHELERTANWNGGGCACHTHQHVQDVVSKSALRPIETR